jgi:hypothetical protein
VVPHRDDRPPLETQSPAWMASRVDSAPRRRPRSGALVLFAASAARRATGRRDGRRPIWQTGLPSGHRFRVAFEPDTVSSPARRPTSRAAPSGAVSTAPAVEVGLYLRSLSARAQAGTSTGPRTREIGPAALHPSAPGGRTCARGRLYRCLLLRESREGTPHHPEQSPVRDPPALRHRRARRGGRGARRRVAIQRRRARGGARHRARRGRSPTSGALTSAASGSRSASARATTSASRATPRARSCRTTASRP